MRSRLEEARKEADEKGEMIDKMKKQLESKEKVVSCGCRGGIKEEGRH